ncbi:MAG: hypothetical protein PVF96_07205 [Candidatus Bathyarchaeota archaeon]
MIDSLTIATTTRYNFPPQEGNKPFPKHLIELSINSLKDAQNQPFQLNQQFFQYNNNLKEYTQTENPRLEMVSLKPRQEETAVTAVDTSTIKIGETRKGILIAIRGANVWKKYKKYKYQRFGPFIFHVTEESKDKVYENLLKTQLNSLTRNHIHNSSSLLHITARISSHLEIWLQNMLSKTATNSLILYDGSLSSGTTENLRNSMRRALKHGRKRGNVVLAFSKITNLRLNGYLITDLLFQHKPPYMLEISGLKSKPPIILFGKIHVAKLSKGNFAFRLDIDENISRNRRVEAVEKLLGNDMVSHSYPETLRLAHILCTFTANEVVAMQHFISNEYDLKLINRPDMHKLLFGPFGKGESHI